MALDYEIKSVRLAPSDDDSHLHIELIGYASPHVEGEEIMIPIARFPMACNERMTWEYEKLDLNAEVEPNLFSLGAVRVPANAKFIDMRRPDGPGRVRAD